MLSAKNPRLRSLRQLVRRRADREAAGQFVVEGPGLIEEALAAAVPVTAIYADGDVAPTFQGRGVAVFPVERHTLERVGDTVTSQGAIATVELPAHGPDAFAARLALHGAPRVSLVLAGVRDPGNAGTVIRVAEAAGVEAVLFSDSAVDPFSPKCVRSSAGSIFRMPVYAEREGNEMLAQLGAAGVVRLGTDAHRGHPYDQTDLTGPVAIVLGNEARGLSDSAEAAIDRHVTIPMGGRVESLNVAMAATVLAFEVARQRRSQVAARP